MSRVLLVVIDGFGLNDDNQASAVNKADKPFIDQLFQEYPHSKLKTDGSSVGLPEGQFGNSEVGHLNIGAGRIVWQELSKINQSIRNGEFFENPALLNSARHASVKNKVHLMGLFSDGGVHSHMDHLIALLKFYRDQGVENIYVHAFTDGRDTSPHGGLEYVKQFEKKAAAIDAGKIASVVGRYYVMDRDRRWERTKAAYDMLTRGIGDTFATAAEALQVSYDKQITDEFVKPAVIGQGSESRIEPGDAVVFFNIRGDRARQITSAFTDPEFSEFEVLRDMNLHYTCFTEYDEQFRHVHVAFPPRQLTNTLGEVLSKNNLRQLRVAETEKYPHVTYFFNGGDEKPWPGEDRLLIQSPKVATYDLQPEMSAHEVTDKLIDKIEDNGHDFIVLNFANPDMVGHTGNFEAAVRAIETIDNCLRRIVNAAISRDYKIMVISDHGNADKMLNEDGTPHTAHTNAPVPFILINHNGITEVKNGILADVAPTVLKLFEIDKPSEMDGNPLF